MMAELFHFNIVSDFIHSDVICNLFERAVTVRWALSLFLAVAETGYLYFQAEKHPFKFLFFVEYKSRFKANIIFVNKYQEYFHYKTKVN